MAPRSSARLSAKANPAASLARSKRQNTSSDKQPKDATERLRKRRKTSHTSKSTELALNVAVKRRTTKGKDEEMTLEFPDLPLDVLLEIFKYLHPLDLLNLSYTTKQLRSVLTADYSTSVWKKVYKTNVHPNFFGDVKYPPECPPGVDIRHYTSVLFGDTCLFCACSKAPIVHWSALTRLCKKCAPMHLLFPPFPKIWGRNYELCWSRTSGRTGFYQENAFKYGNHTSYVLKENFESQIRALKQCVGNAARSAYKAARLSMMRQNFASIHSLESWGDALMRQRKQSSYDRDMWLGKKLRDEGYFADDLGRWKWRLGNLPGLRNTVLSFHDEGWDVIKGKVIPIFESQRQKKRETMLVNTLKQRISDVDNVLKPYLRDRPKPLIYPSLSTIAQSEHFSGIIRAIAGNDDEDEIRERLSTSAAPHIPGILTTWRAEADEFLVALLEDTETPATHAGDEDVDRNPLELATTFFNCQFCTDPISYPRILMHECLRKPRKISSPDSDADECEPLKEVYGVPTVTEESVWNGLSSLSGLTWDKARQFISVDETATRSATAIVQACGEDPDIFTFKAMNDRNVRLECTRCGPAKSKAGTPDLRHIMSWNMAILHDVALHKDTISSAGWSLITSDFVLGQIQEQETKKASRKISTLLAYERCRYCDSAVRAATIVKHLQRKHRVIVRPNSFHTCVYTLLDAPLKAHGCSVKIPTSSQS